MTTDTSPGAIPVVDLTDWRAGDAETRRAIGEVVDTALQRAGFLLVTGHGVDTALRAAVRGAARRFFALPAAVKDGYSARIGGRGWLAPGVEANAWIEGDQTPPDLKESFTVGPETPTGDPEVDGVWFLPNVWPGEVPELIGAVQAWTAAAQRVSDELLELCAQALGQPVDALTRLAQRPTWTFNINRYPPLTEVGAPAPNQYRIGPHTDFGTVTVLDREPGAGGLQVDLGDDGDEHWVDPPYREDALTINIGDLLEHWTGGRWRSGRHRVLPPPAGAPTEELVSLIYFYELDPDALVTPLAPPISRSSDREPVVSGPFIKERLDAISVP